MKSLYLLLSSILIAGPIRENSEKYIYSKFSEDIKINMYTYEITNDLKRKVQNEAKQLFYREKLYYWNISTNDSTIAYAFLDNVKGKTMPITFLVILNNNGTIINTTVIKYREAYGGEVGHKNWLSQFNNYNSNSNYTIGNEIDGITGATISVNSLSKGIQKITILFPLVKSILK